MTADAAPTTGLSPAQVRTVALGEFARRTTRSREHQARVEALVPGAGAAGGLLCFPPAGSPVYLERGDGCWVWDVDGNRCLDFVAGDWTMALGHRNPHVDGALADRLGRGTTLCAPDPDLSYDLARELNARYPSMERMRFRRRRISTR